jgi:hypothetical protein
MSGKSKELRPPHSFPNNKTGLIEMPDVKRWTKQQVRLMKHGEYDWSTHMEARSNQRE